MKPLDVPAVLAGLPDTLELLDVPMFVLTVAEDGVVRYAGLNRAYEARTGLRHGDLAGRTPHEALPARLADGLADRYLHCVDSRRSQRFEEALDLPTGRVWFQTTLSPVDSGGEIIAIVGISADTTELNSRIDDLLADTEALRGKAALMQGRAEACIGRMRAPLSGILTLARMAGEAAADARKDCLARIRDAAAEALAVIEGFEKDRGVRPAPPTQNMTKVEFGLICRDLSAAIDPDRRFAITFPEARVLADAETVETVLRGLLEQAAEEARSWIGLAISPDPRRRQSIRLHVRCDLKDSAGGDPDYAKVMSAVTSQGGNLSIERGGRADGPRATLTFAATLPGRFLEAAQSMDPTEWLSQHPADRASG